MAAPVSTDPVDYDVDRDARELWIVWKDQHRSTYPFDLLRKECPCALCTDQRSKRETQGGLLVLSGPILKPGETQVRAWEPVGRYALTFTWSDGHSTGIYSFDFLRALCPCPVCTEQK